MKLVTPWYLDIANENNIFAKYYPKFEWFDHTKRYHLLFQLRLREDRMDLREGFQDPEYMPLEPSRMQFWNAWNVTENYLNLLILTLITSRLRRLCFHRCLSVHGGGVFVPACTTGHMTRGSLSGVSVWGVGVSVPACTTGHMTRGSLSRGVFVQGVSVQGCLCQGSLSRGVSLPGGLCPGGLCWGVSVQRGLC